jgi:hypothetical protein
MLSDLEHEDSKHRVNFQNKHQSFFDYIINYVIFFRSSSGYGENNKPIIGFSLIQPQNDPKKCVYLMVAHSTAVIVSEEKSKPLKNSRKTSPSKRKSLNRDSDDSNLSDRQTDLSNNEFEIDNDDDDEADSSFVLLYQLMFEKCVNVYLNQTQYYSLYEVNSGKKLIDFNLTVNSCLI